MLAPTLFGTTPPPVHHLKYAFAVYDAEQSSAASAGRFSGPDSGVVDVAFLGSASDDGTRVQATEHWWNELRPEQSVACDLYPTGTLVCDRYPAPTIIEIALLPLLATSFFDGAANSAWQRRYDVTLPQNYYSLSTTVSLQVQKSDGSVVQIEFQGRSQTVHGWRKKETQRGTILYDRSTLLPVSIHDTWSETSLDSGDDRPASIDLKLLKD